jgi:hypothetical protein
MSTMVYIENDIIIYFFKLVKMNFRGLNSDISPNIKQSPQNLIDKGY